MNESSIVRRAVACALLFAVTLASAQDRQTRVDVPQVRYMPIDLGEAAFGNGITNSGQVVGSKSFQGAPKHAAFWPNSHSLPIDLGTLAGFTESRGIAANPRGEIVGAAFPISSARPLFWVTPESAPMELPGLPNGMFGLASSINQRGQIVGAFFSGDFSVQQPVFWPNSNAAAVYLPGLGEKLPISVSLSVNASGNILGAGCDADFVECHAAFWASSTSTPVTLASPGGEFIYT